MATYDTQTLARANPIEAVIAREVVLKRQGREFKGLCPFHNEKTPSFTVVPAEADPSGKGFFCCFGCGASGDQFDFVMRLFGVRFPDACHILGGAPASPERATAAPPEPARDLYADLVAETPPSRPVSPGELLEAWNAKRAADATPKPITRMRPTAVYDYRDAGGDLLGYVVRCDLPGGKKWTPTLRWARCPDGRSRWAIWHFPEPRPLFRAEQLLREPSAVVYVLEGEKSVMAAEPLLGAPVTTWPGGTQAVSHADWSALAGHDLILWPDADQPGEAAMIGKFDQDGALLKPGVLQLATAAGARVKSVVMWDRTKPDGWDCADAVRDGMSRADVLAWMSSRMVPGDELLRG